MVVIRFCVSNLMSLVFVWLMFEIGLMLKGFMERNFHGECLSLAPINLLLMK